MVGKLNVVQVENVVLEGRLEMHLENDLDKHCVLEIHLRDNFPSKSFTSYDIVIK